MAEPGAEKRAPWMLSVLGPGLLVAATGVGAGDLLTGGLAGSSVGPAVLWAVWVGAALKFVLNEGIARWQMATERTVLEGWSDHLGRWIRWGFLAYFLVWTVFTGGALVNACGAAGTAVLPLGQDLVRSKIYWGVIHSVLGAVLVRFGGFRLFERIMTACIAFMFATVLVTAAWKTTDWPAVALGMSVPRIPEGGLGWVLGLLGGVGGTVTLLSYGYWVREEGRRGRQGLRVCRTDLAIAYAVTALFGMAMVLIGSGLDLSRGPTVALDLAAQLEATMGPTGRGLFLAGFWGAVFSSLIGVWQSAPYLFADFVALGKVRDARPTHGSLTRTRPYRAYLLVITLAPLPLLWLPLRTAQLSYAILGSLFMPFLALTLLVMNNRKDWVGSPYRNRWLANGILAATLLFFAYVAVGEATENLRRILSR